jgi:hypothetical protein
MNPRLPGYWQEKLAEAQYDALVEEPIRLFTAAVARRRHDAFVELQKHNAAARSASAPKPTASTTAPQTPAPAPTSKGPTMSAAAARLTILAMTLAQRSPSALRARATSTVATAVADEKEPKLDDIISMLRAVADDESAPAKDRERAQKALEALGEGAADHEDGKDKGKAAARTGAMRPLGPQEQALFDKTNPFIRRSSLLTPQESAARVAELDREWGFGR